MQSSLLRFDIFGEMCIYGQKVFMCTKIASSVYAVKVYLAVYLVESFPIGILFHGVYCSLHLYI